MAGKSVYRQVGIYYSIFSEIFHDLSYRVLGAAGGQKLLVMLVDSAPLRSRCCCYPRAE